MADILQFTKKELFEYLVSVINGEAIKDITALDKYEKEYITNILNKQIAILSKPRTATKTQKANAELKVRLLEVLSGGNGLRVADLVTAFDNQYSSAKLSALVTQLKNEGKVIRTESKDGKAYFSVAE